MILYCYWKYQFPWKKLLRYPTLLVFQISSSFFEHQIFNMICILISLDINTHFLTNLSHPLYAYHGPTNSCFAVTWFHIVIEYVIFLGYFISRKVSLFHSITYQHYILHCVDYNTSNKNNIYYILSIYVQNVQNCQVRK